jgi:ABC-type phosphate/phosphonate transport system substrate-binding protein
VRLTSLLAPCDDRGARALGQWLSRRLDLDIEVELTGDWLDRLAELRAGRLHLALVCGGVVADCPELLPLVAPVYLGESEAVYWSEWAVREGDQRASWSEFGGARVAVNEPESHSGVVHLKHFLRGHEKPRFFDAVVETGSHLGSMQAVAEGRADVAAVDSHVWARMPVPGLRSLRRLGPSPSPPVAVHHEVEERARLGAALAELHSPEVLTGLGIERYLPVELDHYRPLGPIREAARAFALA